MKIHNYNRLNFITWLRVFAVICILMCHYTQESNNPYVAMSAQFFNIGVQIFFIISGFCFGIQGGIVDCKKWFAKRIKRIYIPYEIFLICLGSIYFIQGQKFNLINWGTCILGIQGAVVGVLGADHTWFISSMLLCYLFTPCLAKIWDCFEKSSNQKKWSILTVLFMARLLLALFPHPSVSTLFSPIFFYAIAYIGGREYKSNEIKWTVAVIAFGIMCIMFAGRFIGKLLWDGTILYDRILVGYTQYIAAFAILVLFMFLFKNIEVSKGCGWINKISFEVYLCHYMFVVGPVSLIHITPSLPINMLIITAVSFAMAWILNRISGMIAN